MGSILGAGVNGACGVDDPGGENGDATAVTFGGDTGFLAPDDDAVEHAVSASPSIAMTASRSNVRGCQRKYAS